MTSIVGNFLPEGLGFEPQLEQHVQQKIFLQWGVIPRQPKLYLSQGKNFSHMVRVGKFARRFMTYLTMWGREPSPYESTECRPLP